MLETERLLLRPFTLADAPRVFELACVPEVAATALNIPHPYPEPLAAEWIAKHPSEAKKGMHVFALTRKPDGLLIGGISLGITHRHHRAELGYWLGLPYWNQGYATEAVRRLIAWGFTEHKLNRIFAQHFAGNPASGRVMQKAGMTLEGVLRDCIQKDDVYHDTPMYSILRAEFQNPTE